MLFFPGGRGQVGTPPQETSILNQKPEAAILLKPGTEKKLRHHYPWIHREDVQGTDVSTALPGSVVRVLDASGAFVARATYNASARFPGRVLSLSDEPIDRAFFRTRLRAAIERRAPLLRQGSACRVVFAESDGLPGLIIDKYGEHLAVQVRSAGMERLRGVWLPELLELLEPAGAFERSDMEGRREEGLEPQTDTLHGEVPEEIRIEENGLRFDVPIKTGPKTGFYLDQRDARRKLRESVLRGERVLDLFTYSGGFALSASAGGADALGVDLSAEAVDLARRHASLNGLNSQFECANAFEWLEERPKAPNFDWIVVDPPAIAKDRGKRDSLKWAIWKLAFLALSHLAPSGKLVVFSCSYQLSLQELLETVRLAAGDHGRRLTLLDVTLQPEDHPYLLQFPESLYLKGAWLRAD